MIALFSLCNKNDYLACLFILPFPVRASLFFTATTTAQKFIFSR